MKRILILALFAITGLTLTIATPSFAQESAKQTVNPGEDPNEAMGRSGLTEAEVASVGNCKECLARLKHMRLGDDTTYRPSSDSKTGTGSSKKGTQ
ncbi:MAG: hit locus [Bdellovibrio sp.]